MKFWLALIISLFLLTSFAYSQDIPADSLKAPQNTSPESSDSLKTIINTPNYDSIDSPKPHTWNNGWAMGSLFYLDYPAYFKYLGNSNQHNMKSVSGAGLLSLAMGFDEAGGLGLGTYILEASISSNAFLSGAPLYVYYPIHISKFVVDKFADSLRSKPLKTGIYYTPNTFAFAGGSAWGKYGNHLHAGIRSQIISFNFNNQNCNPGENLFAMLFLQFNNISLDVEAGCYYYNRWKAHHNKNEYKQEAATAYLSFGVTQGILRKF